MKSFANSIVLSFTFCTVSSVLAFGPHLEPLSNGNYYTRRHARQLHACDSEENEREVYCTSEFDFVAAEFDTSTRDDFSLLFEPRVFDGTFSQLLQEQAEALALETFQEHKPFDLHDSWEDCGDDCDECEIPKDWCLPEKTINVMEYLGVTRVKPLS